MTNLNKPKICTTQMLEYLDELRLDGNINMDGAGEYLQDYFDLNVEDSQTVLKYWMNTFGKGGSLMSKNVEVSKPEIKITQVLNIGKFGSKDIAFTTHINNLLSISTTRVYCLKNIEWNENITTIVNAQQTLARKIVEALKE